MKLQNIKLAILLLFAGALASCEKDIAAYNDEARVYFFERNTDLTQTRVTYKSFTFLLLPFDVVKDTFLVRVKIMGNKSSSDRVVRGRAITSGTTAKEGIHYQFIDGIVPADSIYGYIPVVLLRTADIKDSSVNLNLGIAATKDFQPGVGEDSSIVLSWSDNVVKPSNWDGIISLTYYFGTYSAAKWRFIIATTGVDKFPLQQSGRVPPAPGEYTNAGMLDLKAVLKAALQAYNDAHDPDLTDENGQLVTFPL
jgi:hypothetical protein